MKFECIIIFVCFLYVFDSLLPFKASLAVAYVETDVDLTLECVVMIYHFPFSVRLVKTFNV